MLLLASIAAATFAVRRSSLSIISAFVLGAAVLTRPIATYFFIPIAIVTFVCAKRRRKAMTIAFIVASQVLPVFWIARNHRVAGVASLSSIANENLLVEWGAAVLTTANATDLDRLTACQQQLGFRTDLIRAQLPLFKQAMELARRDGVDPTTLNSLKKSIYMRKLAMSILVRHPIALAELIISAVIEIHLIGPLLVLSQYGFDARDAQILFAPFSIVFLLFTGYGIRQLWLRDRVLALLTASAIIWFTLLATIPETTIRYAAVFAPQYATAFAAGVVSFASRAVRYVRERASRRASSGSLHR